MQIKNEQIRVSKEFKSLEVNNLPIVSDQHKKEVIPDHMTTPYGPPSKDAKMVQIPNGVLGLLLGKKAETIKRINRDSMCRVLIAKDKIPGTDFRNVFIEGDEEKYLKAKNLIEELLSSHFAKNNMSHTGDVNPFPGPYVKHKIPNNMVGLVIGKNGEKVKSVANRNNCYIFIPKDFNPNDDFREIELSGTNEAIAKTKEEIDVLITGVYNGVNLSVEANSSGGMLYPQIPINSNSINNLNPLSSMSINNMPNLLIQPQLNQSNMDLLMNKLLIKNNEINNMFPMGGFTDDHSMLNRGYMAPNIAPNMNFSNFNLNQMNYPPNQISNINQNSNPNQNQFINPNQLGSLKVNNLNPQIVNPPNYECSNDLLSNDELTNTILEKMGLKK